MKKGYYNFKRLFNENLIHNDEWLTNGHFIIKKSLLTKSQLKFINNYSKDDYKINQLLGIAEAAKKYFEYSDEKLKFNITHIYINKDDYNSFYDKNLSLALKEEYYNYFNSRKCKIHKGNGSYNPTVLILENEFVGILLPVRLGSDAKLIPITEYNN